MFKSTVIWLFTEVLMEKISCHQCGKEITGKWISERRRFCTLACSRAFMKNIYKKLNPRAHNLISGDVGLLHELKVVCDLMVRGYEVFKAMNGGASCDLAILKNGKLIRVEVTTGTRLPGGKIVRPPKNLNQFEVLATVFHDGEIVYEPKIGD